MIKTYSLTLTGAPQRLSSVYTDPTVGGRDDVPLLQLLISTAPTMLGTVYLGDSALTSAATYGAYLVAGDALELGIFATGGAVKLSDLYVFGTATDVIHILMVPF